MITQGQGLILPDIWDSHVQQRPDAQFLVYEDHGCGSVRSWTYREFDEVINRTSNLFLGLGIESGDAVALQLNNCPELIECIFALNQIGAIYVPIHPEYTVEEAKTILADCDARMLVIEQCFLDYDPAYGEGIETLVVGGDCEHRCFTQLQQAQSAMPPARRREPMPIAEILYTSGTTSTPKGVIITEQNVVFAGYYVNWQLQMRETDRYVTTMAASHVNLQLNALAPVLTAGATLVLLRRYSATRFWQQVRKHRGTLVQAMAMIVKTMLAQPESPQEREHCVREVHYFLPISTEEKERFEARFKVRLLNNYGSTEDLVGVITDYPTGPRRWPSIGRVGPGYNVRIMGEGGELGPGEIGEIQVQGIPGVSLMAGYWQQPEVTAKTLAGNWLRTGDYGYFDEEGWIYFTDRHCDIIKRSGENISCAEVESVLARYPGVAEVAVVGVEDSIRDQAVKAVIVPEAGVQIDVDELTAFCRGHLAAFKIPSIVAFQERLPRGNYGKVLKSTLK
ncbi:AMP-binding protein [Trueperella pyogenes]|uniref:AMP-binding protein n=1 Tax=Trueperella pyogenes TaxID=1661 RepID=UPI0032462CCE